MKHGWIVNREEELRFLKEKFAGKKAEFIVMWGRRRVGKTFVLTHFADKVPAIYYLCVRSSLREQLTMLSEAFADFFQDELLRIHPLENFEEVFLYLSRKTERRFALIIDEFPYLIQADRAIPSIFQRGWDQDLSKNNKIMLILNGSSISMMEDRVLSAASPLYGRRTGQWKLQPMTVGQLKGFFPRASIIDLIRIYTVIGGIPFYASLFDNSKSLSMNIKNKILKKGEVFYEEVEFLLREELKEPRNYFPILSAIASGDHKFGAISSKTGMDRSNLSKYLSVLKDLHLVEREVPITETMPHKSKRGLYFISDPFANFWFHFVRPNLRFLEAGKSDYVWKDKISPRLEQFISLNCEKPIIQIIEELNLRGAFPFQLVEIGRYWDSSTEIDLIGFDSGRENALIGEVKWTNKLIDHRVLKTLIAKAESLDKLQGCKKTYLIVSRSGFQKSLLKMKKENVILLDLRQI
ncbi:MAG: ATP-binding protein [Candidatus Auribacterota bacterium]|nr:ATP-binding protein [Candidatus Auribacterota bacterium]